ncbi:MAG: DUF5058 family protein [Candidatus Methanomethylicia archaeon]
MEEEWLTIATSPIMWIIGFITAGNALIQTLIFYRYTMKAGYRMKMKPEIIKEGLRASLITSIGPCMGIFVGMVTLVIACGGAVAFIRESAGVGSIMFELISARIGAEVAGATLTREGMTLLGLSLILWTMAVGSFEWVVIGGVLTRWLPKMREKMGGGDPKLIGLISIAMMLGAFGRMLVRDDVMPSLIAVSIRPPLIAGIVGIITATVWIKFAEKLKKPWLKEYFMLLALLLGMIITQLLVDAGVIK